MNRPKKCEGTFSKQYIPSNQNNNPILILILFITVVNQKILKEGMIPSLRKII